MAESEQKVILLAGASGYVGNLALDALLDSTDISRVYAITRRPLGREHPRLANRIVQFEQIESQLKGLTCHAALCSLGTTIRQAGSEQVFRQADFDAVLAFARAAKAAQAQRFVVVSAVGADPKSKNFYLRTKGEMEEALAGVGFTSLDILQPSLLLGWRGEIRPLELLGSAFAPLINPFLTGKREPFRAIPARTVAAAMAGVTRSGRRGVQRYTYSAIQSLARIKPVRTVK
jgi:uncharacterized protein YbjT (DUF2867 family)